MKKLIVLFSAVAALAACSKNEVVPAVSGENVEISYKVAPRTKADPQTFDTHNVFASWAYYLPSGKWDENRTTAKIYIGKDSKNENDGATISYDGKVWKDQNTSYYWPKGGSLTFFAYSFNRDNLNLKLGNTVPVVCHNAEDAYGINATIDLNENPNLDLLVAEIAKDKTQNEKVHDLNGVPTLFKHKFSRIQFAVKKKEEYKNIPIILNSITFNNVSHAGHYCQFNKVNDNKPFTTDYCQAVGLTGPVVYTTTNFEVTYSPDYVPVTNETNYIYIPQDFKDEKDETDPKKIATIEVKYTVTYKEGISKTYTKILNVKDIFTRWEVGKKYTFNLSFSLDEINWAPAVGDWEDGNNSKDVEIKDPEKVEKVGDTTIKADGYTTSDEQF